MIQQITAFSPEETAILEQSWRGRQMLAYQQAYGGGGAGFAPMASPLTAFRRTIKTQSKGWTSYNIMQRKAAPQNLRENFYVSGWVCQPAAGASTRWENSDYRKRLDSCTAARVFFISPG